MKIFFLHNHYIPEKIKYGEIDVNSVIIPEFYPDLNSLYLNDLCYFSNVDSYINYVTENDIYPVNNYYAIENINIINNNITNLLYHYKHIGIRVIQLYCGKDNQYFCINSGLTQAGIKLLDEIFKANLILDLSHIPDNHILAIALRYPGKKIVSHCACADLYLPPKSRSNSLTSNTIRLLTNHVEIFGIPFINDIVSSKCNEQSSIKIFNDIILNILTFNDIAGSRKIALAPDFIDTRYFSRKFNTKLIFPKQLLRQDGLLELAHNLCQYLSSDEIDNILYKNVERLLLDN